MPQKTSPKPVKNNPKTLSRNLHHFSSLFFFNFRLISCAFPLRFPEIFRTWKKCRNLRFTRKFSSGSRVGALKIHRKTIQKTKKTPSKRAIGFSIIFRSIFPPKTTPKASRKPSKNASQEHMKKDTVFHPLLSAPGAILGPKRQQIRHVKDTPNSDPKHI